MHPKAFPHSSSFVRGNLFLFLVLKVDACWPVGGLEEKCSHLPITEVDLTPWGQIPKLAGNPFLPYQSSSPLTLLGNRFPRKSFLFQTQSPQPPFLLPEGLELGRRVWRTGKESLDFSSTRKGVRKANLWLPFGNH